MPFYGTILIWLYGLLGRLSMWAFGLIFAMLPMITVGVMTALGLGVITYTGLDYGLEIAIDMLNNKFADRPAQYIDLMAFLGVDDAIKTITSAMSAAIALKVVSTSARIGVTSAPTGSRWF